MTRPKYRVGQRVWFIWTEQKWTAEPVQVLCVVLGVELREGEEVAIYSYAVGSAGNEITVAEHSLFASEADAQALCDKWNAYPSEAEEE